MPPAGLCCFLLCVFLCPPPPQIVNTGQEDLQALVVLDSPPVDIWTLANWSTPDKHAVRQWPYTWDRACPPILPVSLQQLAQQQQRGLQADGGPAGNEL